MGRIQSSIGLITGTDILGTVDQLIAISAQPRDRLINRTDTLRAQQQAIAELTASVIGVQLAGNQLAETSLFRSKKAESSNADALSVTASNDAAPATHTIRTLQTAATHTVTSLQRFADTDTALGIVGSLAIHPDGFLDGSVSLRDLNDGRGVESGSIRITDRSGTSADIDFSNARSIEDVLQAINDAKINVFATTEGNAIKLIDQTGASDSNLIVEQLGDVETAADLGIWGIDVNADSVTGFELDLPDGVSSLRGASLDELAGGIGIGPLGDLDVTLSTGADVTIDLSSATTISEVIDAINASGQRLIARLNDAKNGLQIRDVSGGTGTFEITPGDGTATKLGVETSTDDDIIVGSNLNRKTVTNDTLLADLNQGIGIDSGSFTVTDSSGAVGAINLTVEEITTVGELIDAFDNLGLGITAQINDAGDGIAIVDTAGGLGTLAITDTGNGTAAADLRIAGSASDQIVGGVLESALVGTQSDSFEFTADDTLETIVERLNTDARYGEASAPLNDDGTYSLRLRSLQGGQRGRIAINTTGFNLDLRTESRGQDAIVALSTDNGAERFLTATDGVIDDEPSGLTLTLKQLSADPITVTVDKNPEAVLTSASTFVDQFNKLVEKLDALTFFNAESEEVGLLFGSGEALRIETSYSRLLSGTIRGAGELRSLGQVGIRFNDQGKLELDRSKLSAAIENNATAVEEFFTTEDTGLANRLGDLADRLAGESNSVLIGRSTTIGSQIERNNERVTALNIRLNNERERLLTQFYAMEEAIAKIQTNQSFISQIQPITIPN